MKKKLRKNLAVNIKKRLHKRAWALMSEYKRRLAGGICFTCGDVRPWKEQQAGHYIHKNCLDYELINIHCQCAACNKWKHGNLGIYGEKLIKIYGIEAVEELRRKSEIIHKFTIEELENIIESLEELMGGWNE